MNRFLRSMRHTLTAVWTRSPAIPSIQGMQESGKPLRSWGDWLGRVLLIPLSRMLRSGLSPECRLIIARVYSSDCSTMFVVPLDMSLIRSEWNKYGHPVCMQLVLIDSGSRKPIVTISPYGLPPSPDRLASMPDLSSSPMGETAERSTMCSQRSR